MVTSNVQNALVEAATKILSREGAAGVRVDAVARNSKVNKRMIYHYFGDREGLIEAVYSRQAAVLLAPDAITSDNQAILRKLLSSVFAAGVEFGPVHTSTSTGSAKVRVQQALQILLPRFMAGVFGIDPAHQNPTHSDLVATLSGVTEQQWASFCVEVLSRLLPGVAQNVSKHSQTKRKPRYRIPSHTRRLS